MKFVELTQGDLPGSHREVGSLKERKDDETMTRQKSEDHVVPEGVRKAAAGRRREAPHRGKVVPVKEAAQQLKLFFATAENPPKGGAEAVGRGAPSSREPGKVPKAKDTRPGTGSATMEEVVGRLETAFEKVAANDGAAGPDRLSVGEVREQLPVLLPKVAQSLLAGTYVPGAIRRVEIPKSGGGKRGLGIPNVIDRVVQEAVRAVLEPLHEPTFHPSSHGFRPGRGCQTAIAEARGYVQEGRHWVVDMDLEKFFDRVHHQRLMARLATRVGDQRLLALIGRMLKAQVVMPDGVKVSNEEGVPQGGPLSPLLSNIVLSELDNELSRRGLRFVRYADDCNIYVRSERAGQRVMASVADFIARRLRLKVNEAKSAVARPETRHFLGYRLAPQPDGPVEVLLSKRSETRLAEAVRERTPRSRGRSLEATIAGVNAYLRGWFGHFRVCTSGIERVIRTTDAHIRRRLRAIVLKHWKTKLTTVRRLILLGVKRKTAWRRVYDGRKSIWSLSHDPAVDRGLPNAYFAVRRLESLLEKFRETWEPIVAPRSGKPQQLVLFGGPKRS